MNKEAIKAAFSILNRQDVYAREYNPKTEELIVIHAPLGTPVPPRTERAISSSYLNGDDPQAIADLILSVFPQELLCTPLSSPSS